MDNLARQENLDQEIMPFLNKIARMSDRTIVSKLANEFLYRFPPQRGVEIASLLTHANPFYLADIPEEFAREIAVNLDIFADAVMRAKLAATRARQLNVLVACAPKSASTFIQDALCKALALPSGGLFTATIDAGSGSMLGANLKEQEPDELALIRAGLNRRGYVAQHHMRCSPYAARQLSFYNIRPIVTYRNILDTVVSMDDMVMEWRAHGASASANFFNDGLPGSYQSLPREDRLMILAQRWTAWLVQFYVTWRKCEKMGLIKPLFVSYEEDFLGDKQLLATRIASHLGADMAATARLTEAFGDRSNAGAKRLNKGVAGRGKDVPEKVRAQVLRIAHFYRDEEDISPLVGA